MLVTLGRGLLRHFIYQLQLKVKLMLRERQQLEQFILLIHRQMQMGILGQLHR
jgi:hypothetical protein